MTDEELEIAVLEILNDIPRLGAETNITLANDDEPIYTEDGNVHIIKFWGGLNGGGDITRRWVNYLNNASQIIEELNALPGVYAAYLVEWINDCCDDVFDLTVAVEFEDEMDLP